MVFIFWMELGSTSKLLLGGFEPASPLKNHGVKVSWDDEIPYIYIYMESHNPFMFQSPPTSH